RLGQGRAGRQRGAVGAVEREGAARGGRGGDGVAAVVDHLVVPRAQADQVVQVGGAAVDPVPDVVQVDPAGLAARVPAPAVVPFAGGAADRGAGAAPAAAQGQDRAGVAVGHPGQRRGAGDHLRGGHADRRAVLQEAPGRVRRITRNPHPGRRFRGNAGRGRRLTEPTAGAVGSVSTLVPAWTTTWYTSASSAPATFPARNDSATATSPSARSDDVRTAGPPAAGGPAPGPAAADAAAAPDDSAAAGVSAETPPRGSPARSAQAARKAFSRTAPCKGGSRNVPDREPSSSTRHTSRRRTRVAASSAWVTWRCARANRSSWFAVIGPASSASPASSAGVAIRVSARTLAYDSFASANRARITGRSRSARATRTCSRAVPDDIWHFHDSHCAHEPISQLAHPRRASKSASRTRNRHVAAARCPASSQICASTRSSGTRAGSAGDAATSAGGETAAKIEPGLSESNIHLTLAPGSDKTG